MSININKNKVINTIPNTFLRHNSTKENMRNMEDNLNTKRMQWEEEEPIHQKPTMEEIICCSL